MYHAIRETLHRITSEDLDDIADLLETISQEIAIVQYNLDNAPKRNVIQLWNKLAILETLLAQTSVLIKSGGSVDVNDDRPSIKWSIIQEAFDEKMGVAVI